jgi:hypothetical protein
VSDKPIRWSEAIELGIPEPVLTHALEFQRHYWDDHNEIWWGQSVLDEFIELIALESRNEGSITASGDR